jgi:AcrR family transcriptional regulator
MSLKQTESEAALRRERIVSAATDVFLRYGHARTTMGDVAQGSGISRPALYLVFPRKEDIFEAVIERLTRDFLAEVEDSISKLKGLDRRLHVFCEKWAGRGYDLTRMHPDAKDVFDLAFPCVRNMYATLVSALAEVFREALARSALKHPAEDLAWALVFSMRGLKDLATDGQHMRTLIALEVDVFLTALKPR